MKMTEKQKENNISLKRYWNTIHSIKIEFHGKDRDFPKFHNQENTSSSRAL